MHRQFSFTESCVDKLSGTCLHAGNEREERLALAAPVAGTITTDKRENLKEIYERLLVNDTSTA